MKLSPPSFSELDASSWKEKFHFLRFFFPFTTIFLSSWLSFLRIPGLSFISPDYSLCILYFWALYRPDLIPLGLLLWVGIIIDMLGGGVIGITPLVWFLAYGLVLSQRRYLIKANFSLLWLGLGGLFLIVHSVEWFCVFLFKGKGVSILPLFISFLLTLGVYPFISFLLSRIRSIFSLSFLDTPL